MPTQVPNATDRSLAAEGAARACPIDHASREITDYMSTYHHRPQSRLGYRTRTEVATTWRKLQREAT